ncbi:hypothetical protein TREES_T100002505 [Tupaia chinensis]|uniref:Uncharacterized protein n=1 Tax=Tupaia chinensis TaxID=246437 RepID=L9L9F4_TUPCH|nr:hypothetical protein TREES_T100002505 [Tupaia chinensis]
MKSVPAWTLSPSTAENYLTVENQPVSMIIGTPSLPRKTRRLSWSAAKGPALAGRRGGVEVFCDFGGRSRGGPHGDADPSVVAQRLREVRNRAAPRPPAPGKRPLRDLCKGRGAAAGFATEVTGPLRPEDQWPAGGGRGAPRPVPGPDASAGTETHTLLNPPPPLPGRRPRRAGDALTASRWSPAEASAAHNAPRCSDPTAAFAARPAPVPPAC